MLLCNGLHVNAQRSWDYSWGYTTTMQYYSNKVFRKDIHKNDTAKGSKREKYVMFPHKGKTTYDNKEEKVSDFKLWQIATEALKEVEWDKLGFSNPYKARDSAFNELMGNIRKAFAYHDSLLTKIKLPVNDLAVTWALGLSFAGEIINGGGLSTQALNKKIDACRQNLVKTEVINKTNYEKLKDQIRLVDLGIRPYLQYQEAIKSANSESQKQASNALAKFLADFETR